MIPEKLQEMMNLCSIPPNEHESFLEIFSDRWKNGYRDDRLWLSLCDHGYSELRDVSSGDEMELLRLLENFTSEIMVRKTVSLFLGYLGGSTIVLQLMIL